jgi:hypothetical protein
VRELEVERGDLGDGVLGVAEELGAAGADGVELFGEGLSFGEAALLEQEFGEGEGEVGVFGEEGKSVAEAVFGLVGEVGLEEGVGVFLEERDGVGVIG